MIDIETGEVWVDMFSSIGHNSWAEYHNNIKEMVFGKSKVTMEEVKELAEKMIAGGVEEPRPW